MVARSDQRKDWRLRNLDHRLNIERLYLSKNRSSVYENAKRRRKERRLLAIQKYGGRCACCGEGQSEFLSFDHIHSDGADHRRDKSIRSDIVGWIIRNDYPDTIQLLCMNCNHAKDKHGVCPHELNRKIALA